MAQGIEHLSFYKLSPLRAIELVILIHISALHLKYRSTSFTRNIEHLRNFSYPTFLQVGPTNLSDLLTSATSATL